MLFLFWKNENREPIGLRDLIESQLWYWLNRHITIHPVCSLSLCIAWVMSDRCTEALKFYRKAIDAPTLRHACHRCPSTTRVRSELEGDVGRSMGQVEPPSLSTFDFFLFPPTSSFSFSYLKSFDMEISSRETSLFFLFAAVDVITHNRLRCVECSSFLRRPFPPPSPTTTTSL